MPILLGIDGTDEYWAMGEKRDLAYEATFRKSFVSRLCRDQGPNTKYLAGPILQGTGLVRAIDDGYNFIQGRLQAGVPGPILLTGYSRGAVGVVEIAKRMHDPQSWRHAWMETPGTRVRRGSLSEIRRNQERGSAPVGVRAMLLLDPVDMHGLVDADTIPSSVDNVLELRRAPESGSRGSMNLWGLFPIKWRVTPPTRFETITSNCTHGGVGGVPWPVPESPRRIAPPVIMAPGSPSLPYTGPRPPEKPPGPDDRVDEGFPDFRTNITYHQDRVESEKLWHSDKVQSFIGQHGFQ